jgi:glutathione S-transferase
MNAVTGFRVVPTFAYGLVRDLRVRWALEEAGFPFDSTPIDFADKMSEAFRRKNPFGLVPVFEADGRATFESGAILLQLAEQSDALMPTDRQGRADTIMWMFAALSTVEPPVNNLSVMDLQQAGEPWVALARPGVLATVNTRLGALDAWLEGREYLTGRFTAADILMAAILRLVGHTNVIAGHPNLAAYASRCEARPAFQRALVDQLAGYSSNVPVAPG